MNINDFFKVKYEKTDILKKNYSSKYSYPHTHFSISRDKFKNFVKIFEIPDEPSEQELEDIFSIFLYKKKNEKMEDKKNEKLIEFLFKKQEERYFKVTKEIIKIYVEAKNKPKYVQNELYYYEKIFLLKKEDLDNLKLKFEELFFLSEGLAKSVLNEFKDLNINTLNNFNLNVRKKIRTYKENHLDRILDLKKNYKLLLDGKIKKEDLIRSDFPIYCQYLNYVFEKNLLEEYKLFLSQYYIKKHYKAEKKYNAIFFNDNFKITLDSFSNIPNKKLFEEYKFVLSQYYEPRNEYNSKVFSGNLDSLFNIFYENRKKNEESKKTFKRMMEKHVFLDKYYNVETKEYELTFEDFFQILFILENIVERKIYKQQKYSKEEILKNLEQKYYKDKNSGNSYYIFYAREVNKLKLSKKIFNNLSLLEKTLNKIKNISLGTNTEILECLISIVEEIIIKLVRNKQIDFKVKRKINSSYQEVYEFFHMSEI